MNVSRSDVHLALGSVVVLALIACLLGCGCTSVPIGPFTALMTNGAERDLASVGYEPAPGGVMINENAPVGQRGVNPTRYAQAESPILYGLSVIGDGIFYTTVVAGIVELVNGIKPDESSHTVRVNASPTGGKDDSPVEQTITLNL